MTLEEVTEDKLNACLEVIHAAFQTVADEFGLTRENCPTNGAFMPFERLRVDFVEGILMYTIYENNKPVAFVQLIDNHDGFFEMEKLAVLPEYRHRGYGKELVEHIIAKAMELSADKIVIGIIEENTRLKTWYKNLGFIHTGTREFTHLPFTVGFMEFRILRKSNQKP